MDAPDWRTQLQPDSRQRIVAKITETLKIHCPISGPEGLMELRKIAARFEKKIFTDATSQSDYLRKISLRMLTMETKSQTNRVAKSSPLNTAGGSQNPQYPASQSMQSQVRNPGQLQISLANQSLARKQLLSQKIQNDTANPGIQGPRSCSQIRSNHSNIEPNREATDWKTLFQPESRVRIVTKMMEILKKHLPITAPEELVELVKVAVRVEEKIFTAAVSQMDYLRKISLKMQTLETKSQKNVVASSSPLNSTGGSQNPRDPASHSMQSQVSNLGQSHISLANQSLAQQQLLSQNIQNNIINPAIQGPISNHSDIELNVDATDWKTLLEPGSRQSTVTKVPNAVVGGDRLWEASHDQNTENHHPVGGIHIWDAGRPETHKIEPEVGGFLSWDGGRLETNHKGLEGRGFRLCSDGSSETETDRKELEEPGYLDLTLKL